MTDRIGELRVRVRAPPEAAPPDADVRRYSIAVWEAVATTLERRHPGRVYRVRTWRTRWRLTCASLQERPSSRLVAELVDVCEREAPLPPGALPDATADVVCFASEPERVASWWIARVAGAPSNWAWSDLDAAPSVATVMRALGPADGDAAERLVATADPSGRASRRLAEHRRVGVPAPAPPPAPPTTVGGEAEPGSPAPSPLSAPAQAGDATARRATGSAGERARPAGAQVPPGSASGEPGAGDRAPGGSDAPAAPAVGGLAGLAPNSTPPEGPPAPSPARGAPVRGAVRTEWGGLVYLLAPMLECHLMEALWEACLDERGALRRALSALCGEDPVAGILSGSDFPGSALVDGERLEAVRERLVAELRGAIPRRGLASWPPLAFAAPGDGRACLHAAALPWAIAAWPDARGARDEAASLAGGALVAEERAPWRAPLSDSHDAALVEMMIGIPATLLSLRMRWTGDAGAFAGRWLRRPAWIARDGEAIELRFGADAVDLALRRSGADADPGWVPWLGRTVRLRYDATEAT